jgi:hypothetical protein
MARPVEAVTARSDEVWQGEAVEVCFREVLQGRSILGGRVTACRDEVKAVVDRCLMVSLGGVWRSRRDGSGLGLLR